MRNHLSEPATVKNACAYSAPNPAVAMNRIFTGRRGLLSLKRDLHCDW